MDHAQRSSRFVHRLVVAGMLLVAVCGMALSGCKSKPSSDPEPGEGESSAGTSSESSARSEEEPEEPADLSNTAEEGAEKHPQTHDPKPPPQTLTIRTLMNEQVAPRFARDGQRDDLVAVLKSIPKHAPVEFRASFEEIVAQIPEEGSLAPTCKTCHVQHRLDFKTRRAAQPSP